MQQSRFETLALRLRPGIVSQVMMLTRDADLADDVAQDTLLRLWQLRDRLDEYRSVEALARVVARNLVLDEMRRRGRTVTLDTLSQEDHAVAARADRDLLEAEAQAKLDRVMASLAPSQRIVLRMRHTEGMEMAEIARITGTTEANVRVMLSRARAKVKQQFLER